MSCAELEPLRTLAFGGISATYAAVGTASSHPTRLICFINNTQGDLIWSRDPTLAAGEIFTAASSYKLFDIQSNLNVNKEDSYVFRKGTQWYVKQVTAPISDSVYLEMVY